LRAAASLQLARGKLATGNAADAIPFAVDAGNDPTARLTLARALLSAGQNARARAELQRMTARGESQEAAVLLGWVELREGRTPEARAPAERAPAVAPATVAALMLG